MKRIWLSLAAVWILIFFTGCQLFTPVQRNCWVEEETGRSYHDENGDRVTGWQQIEGVRYHFGTDGLLSSGWVTLDSGTYCFRADGTPISGWVQRDGTDCYLGPDGVLVTGWYEVDGATRFFQEDGSPASGWLETDGKVFYLDDNGCPLTGALELDGAHYWFREDGSQLTGWLETDSCSAYYLPDGTRAQGWTEIGETKYLFREDGSLVTGWYEEGEYRYYFLEDGTPAQGPLEIEGKTYHFTPEGIQIWLVNPWNFLPEDYQVELVPAANGYKIAEDCAEALEQMLEDCRAAGHYPVLCSGYRSYWDQVAMFQAKIAEVGSTETAKTIVAVPNTSEHQLGLAVDIVAPGNSKLNRSQGDTPVQKWLMEHCWDYGFILRYPDGTTDITGIIYEPWHYRYVGIPVAKIMQENGLTLEEYLGAA